MEDVPYEWIYAAQVREIQAAFAVAHKALVQWGIWSRQRGGIFPSLAPPSMWEMYAPSDADKREWVEASDQLIVVPQTEVKAEAANDDACDEKLAEEMDVLIHELEFPAVWRKCLSAAYVSREIPEYQFPREATACRPRGERISHDTFLLMLDGALRHIEKQLEHNQQPTS